jgi:hypothetical protein
MERNQDRGGAMLVFTYKLKGGIPAAYMKESLWNMEVFRKSKEGF